MKNVYLICFFIVLMATSSSAVYANDSQRNVVARIGMGAQNLTAFGMFAIPIPDLLKVAVDLPPRVRLQVQFSHWLLVQAPYVSIGGGIWINLDGENARSRGGCEINLPLVLEAGYFKGEIEDKKGASLVYRHQISALLIGPSIGVEFTWWKKNAAGFFVHVGGGYMFKIDVNSDYDTVDNVLPEEEPEDFEHKLGTFVFDVLIGVAF